MTARSVLAAAALVAWCGAAAPVAAQSCALVDGTGVAVAVGAASYDVASLSGAMVGLDAGIALAPASVRIGYRTLLLDGPDPHIGRVAGAIPIPFSPAGTAICAIGHGGVSRLAVGGEGNTVVAGGIGLRIVHPLSIGGVRTRPYAEVRGLAASSSGSILGVDVAETGMAVGVEGGIRAAVGRFTVSLTGAVDGFAAGLGLTPYPNAAGEVGIGICF